jgi:hypothetical protein
LGAAVIVYALFSLHSALTTPTETDSVLKSYYPDLADIPRQIAWLLYGGLIASTIIMQGLGMIYYATRARYLSDYLDKTPPWVIELNRSQPM